MNPARILFQEMELDWDLREYEKITNWERN